MPLRKHVQCCLFLQEFFLKLLFQTAHAAAAAAIATRVIKAGVEVLRRSTSTFLLTWSRLATAPSTAASLLPPPAAAPLRRAVPPRSALCEAAECRADGVQSRAGPRAERPGVRDRDKGRKAGSSAPTAETARRAQTDSEIPGEAGQV